jgi:hypothetical protein
MYSTIPPFTLPDTPGHKRIGSQSPIRQSISALKAAPNECLGDCARMGSGETQLMQSDARDDRSGGLCRNELNAGTAGHERMGLGVKTAFQMDLKCRPDFTVFNQQ